MNPYRMLILGLLLFISGCSTVPTGPSVLVLPGAGRDFGTFSRDDGFCRQHALAAIGGTTPSASGAETGLAAAAIGTAVGAASGAAFGGGYGAAVGAGAGLIGGSAIGAGMGYQASYQSQQRYDHAYIQCMYGQGHQVPIPGVIARPQGSSSGPVSPGPGAGNSGGMPLPPSGGGLSLPPSSTQGNLPLPPR